MRVWKSDRARDESHSKCRQSYISWEIAERDEFRAERKLMDIPLKLISFLLAFSIFSCMNDKNVSYRGDHISEDYGSDLDRGKEKLNNFVI